VTPANPRSYLEQCIAALPPEKREAAWHAFQEISETGDDTYLSKLLAVLEANGAYAKRIPNEMTEAGCKVIEGIHAVLNQLGEAEAYRRQLFKDTISNETGRLVNSMPVREINAGIVRQNGLLDHLQKAADKIDQGVSTGVSLFFALLAFVGGIALTGWMGNLHGEPGRQVLLRCRGECRHSNGSQKHRRRLAVYLNGAAGYGHHRPCEARHRHSLRGDR